MQTNSALAITAAIRPRLGRRHPGAKFLPTIIHAVLLAAAAAEAVAQTPAREVRTEAMAPGVTAVQAKVRLPGSLARKPANSMLAAELAVQTLRHRFSVVRVAAATVLTPLLVVQNRREMVKQTPAAVVAEVQGRLLALICHGMAQTAALASCASACTRRARKRGKDNYAVIQERDKDGGSKSTAL